MWRKIFNKKHKKSNPSVDPFVDSLRRQLSKLTPEERMKFGGKELYNFLLRPTAEPGSPKLPIQIMLYTMGLMAGCACQEAARKQKPSQIMTIQLNDGKIFYTGPLILQKIFEEKYSPWAFIGGGMDQIGRRKAFESFDVVGAVGHSVDTMGTSEFGEIRAPKSQRPDIVPDETIRELWEKCREHLEQIVPSRLEWPGCYGEAIQLAILYSKNIIEPEIALSILAESMLTSSKMPLK